MALALSAGCGDDGYGRRYAVSGKVTYKGQPLKQGMVTFTPADANTGRTASGHVVDGAYALTTVDNEDGALPGPYQVAIASVEVDASKAEERAKASGAGLDEALVAKAKRTHSIPRKYSLPSTSGLTREVKEQDNTFDFDLTD